MIEALLKDDNDNSVFEMTSYDFKRKIQNKIKLVLPNLGVVEDETVAIAWFTYVI